MTIDRETVIRLAKMPDVDLAWGVAGGFLTLGQLERFAALVLEHEHKPLSEWQIVDIVDAWGDGESLADLMRAVEAAHGITNKESSDAEY